MSEHFFGIVFYVDDWKFDGRDEVEDPLEEALAEAGVGEVTGGGSGMGLCNIDVNATNFEEALNIIRQVLKALDVAPSTEINYYNEIDGRDETYSVYG